jgi:hypothetical protein
VIGKLRECDRDLSEVEVVHPLDCLDDGWDFQFDLENLCRKANFELGRC